MGSVPTDGHAVGFGNTATGDDRTTGDDTNAVPYVGLLIIGFLVGGWGHGMKSKLVIALGIAIIILAIVLFQIEILNTSPDKVPPGV